MVNMDWGMKSLIHRSLQGLHLVGVFSSIYLLIGGWGNGTSDLDIP